MTSSFYSEIELDPLETRDLWEMYHRIPFMLISRNAFISMVLHCPMKVWFGNMEMSEELKILFELYYTKWNIDKYDWLQCFGICPWYIENVKSTSHRIPVVPPFGAGKIFTYLNKSNQQEFKYVFNNGVKKQIFFEVKSHPPGLDGHYYSPISSLLYEWRSSKIIREAHEIASYNQARVQHVFEYRPGKNNGEDTNIMQLEQFGDSISSTVIARQEHLDAVRVNVRTDDFQMALQSASDANRGIKRKYGTNSAFLNSDTNNKKWELENSNLIDRGVILKPDFAYKAVQGPHVHIGLVEVMTRLDRMASAVMDIPIGIIESTGTKTTAGIQGNFRVLNERIKDWQQYFKTSTKKAFLIMYGDFLQGELSRAMAILRKESPHKMLELYADASVEVEMACTPIANISDIQNLIDRTMLTTEKGAEHLFNILGLPLSDLNPNMEDQKIEPSASNSKASKKL